VVILASISQCVGVVSAQTRRAARAEAVAISDEALARSLEGGFRNGYAQVNGTRLHYVAGGSGELLLLLPGWPETWWEFHKIMPRLANNYRVVAVDLRGMGGSDKPRGGYTKKTMAEDINQLIHALEAKSAYVAGHDIGSMVAYSLAANHPEAVRKLVLMDNSHPDESWYAIPMLPRPDAFGRSVDEQHPVYLWWFAFNQLNDLPEHLLQDRTAIFQAVVFNYLLTDRSSLSARDRAVYAAAYSSPDAIRAGDAWYQTFGRDIEDFHAYDKLTMPVLGLGGQGYNRLKVYLQTHVSDSRVQKIDGAIHYLPEEQPTSVSDALQAFFGNTEAH
jgi:pimeloyl-ACP methyl ester carboxylesterase